MKTAPDSLMFWAVAVAWSVVAILMAYAWAITTARP